MKPKKPIRKLSWAAKLKIETLRNREEDRKEEAKRKGTNQSSRRGD
jgi:hypothetical protein|tara:strand:- start:595 stop:732 length:138 start_codon:yes stop_codon:yes gene_type:complete